MQTSDAPLYRVWNLDHSADAPIELPALVNLVQSKRVGADTWIFSDEIKAWKQASELPELSLFFTKAGPAKRAAPSGPWAEEGIKLGSLRRIKIFAQMDANQLEDILAGMELLRFERFACIVRKGEPGDAMYFLLEGELRARMLIDGSETTLATLAPGDFFGEISLLDRGMRSADVVANLDSAVLKLSTQSFERIVQEAPHLASPLLLALSKSIVNRVRNLTKRYEDSVHFSHLASSVDH